MGLSQALKELRTASGLPEPAAPRQTLSIDELRPNPDQPRKDIDETSEAFRELVESIRLHGLLQPVAVVGTEAGYLLIAGERRWRAFRQLAAEDPARWGRIPVTVLEAPGGDLATASVVLGLLENVVRDDLRPGEKAAAVARLRSVQGWGLQEVADFLGLAVRTVQRMSAIAQHEPLVEALNEGQLTMRQAAAAAERAAKAPDEALDLVGRMAAPPERPATTAAPEPSSVWDPAQDALGAEVAKMVRLAETPLRAVKPRVAAMTHDEYRSLVRELHRSVRHL